MRVGGGGQYFCLCKNIFKKPFNFLSSFNPGTCLMPGGQSYAAEEVIISINKLLSDLKSDNRNNLNKYI